MKSDNATIFGTRIADTLKLALTFLIVIAFQLAAHAQNDSTRLITIATKLEKQTSTRPIEKVYLHLNKPDYNAGDTIWFKGYITVGPHHQPSALSGVLYVELIDDRDKVTRSLMLKNTNGVTIGDIALDDKLVPGSYRIRAYTNWMRNAGPDYFFNKTIAVGDLKTNAVFANSTFAIKQNGDLVNAQLAYLDKLGRAYDHKEVSYELRTDTTLVIKGKGITDERGVLHLSFADKPLSKQNIITHVKLLSGVVVDKIIPVNLQNGSVDIQFFPEGGSLITGVRSKVAFKAIGINGLGVYINGVIADNDHKEVAEFTTQHAGMGVFAFTPDAGKTYTATITLPDSSATTISFQPATSKGFVLAVNNTDSTQLNVRVTTNEATLQENQNKTIYLIGQSAGTIYYTTAIKLDQASFTASIPKSRFPTGVAQFTLFSSTMEPLNERIVFINNPADILNLNLNTSKTIYAAGEKINLELVAKQNQSVTPVAGNFSVSVYNESQTAANENTESTILSNILLTSDLKGYIEEPNYYFNKPNQQTNAELDNLMLTQGYRRFDWKQVMTGNYQQISFQSERSLGISGMLTTSAGKPVANGKVTVISALDNLAIDTLSDAAGRFSFKSIEFPDSTKLVIQARKANDGKNVNISLDDTHTVPLIYKSNIGDASVNLLPPLFNKLTGNYANNIADKPIIEKADTEQIAATIKANTLNVGNRGKALKEVVVNQKKMIKPDQSNLWGTVKPDAVITSYQLADYATITAAIMVKAPGLYYKNGKIYDPVALKQSLFKKDPIPIPVAINGFLIDRFANIDDLIQGNLIDDVKIMQGSGIKLSYGIPIADPNDKVIVITTKKFAGTDTSSNEKIKLNAANHNINLKQIDIKGRKNAGTELAPWKTAVVGSANLNGPGMADQVITDSQLDGCLTISDCLQSKIPGIITKGGNFYFTTHMAQSVTAPPPIVFIIDGQLISGTGSVDILNNVTVSTVKAIEVLKSSSFLSIYGSNASGGALVITTKTDSPNNSNAFAYKEVPGIIYTTFNGFQKAKQFYVPKYTYTGTSIKPADTRTAIYWNPNIITDGTGKCTLEFYNSDVKGIYRAVVEGIDNYGQIGRYVYRYKVE